ncbi:heavy metal-responsive transcriptional regulator [Microbacterium aurantiacum]|uniref:Heavy metal-responsive transcriptional regulator n=1 Tax=Microbacterium aurantiacum TaxID=162393 RepID=A0AAJ2LWN7_9MICO|nr:heavy metal-responsive transcriptional regulator [Microbacterium aurantiacum]MDS0245892.1 heavy metal-responsive transcriptional regulator [Microbacterium aurantiacum]
MRIGDLAATTGVSTQTLRFYEREGLLSAPSRQSNGYRVYDDEVASRVGFIRAAQSAGLTLADIAGVLTLREDGQAPCSHVHSLLDDKLNEVRVRQQELARLETELVDMLTTSSAVDPATCSERSICNVIPRPLP